MKVKMRECRVDRHKNLKQKSAQYCGNIDISGNSARQEMFSLSRFNLIDVILRNRFYRMSY